MNLEIMYPTIPFSPKTQLTTAINETDTRLFVADASVFGALPTLITLINPDGIGETVLALEAGPNFVDVTRDIEGESQAWSVHTVIMRTLASADIAALQGNISDLNDGIDSVQDDISGLDNAVRTAQSGISSLSNDITSIQDDVDNLGNTKANKTDIPTTPGAVGADPAGSAGAVQSNLTQHTSNGNIHTTAQEKSAWNAKQPALTFDTTPTSGSTNPVTSGGIKTALDGKAGITHASRHSEGGADPITPVAIGAAKNDLSNVSDADFAAKVESVGVGMQIETISYAGNNRVGVSYPTSITASFEPKLLVITAVQSSSVRHFEPYIFLPFPLEAIPKNDSFHQIVTMLPDGSSREIYFRRSLDGKTISWYSNNAVNQMDYRGTTYHCILIG